METNILYSHRTSHRESTIFSTVGTFDGKSWAEAWDLELNTVACTKAFSDDSGEQAHKEICRLVSELAN